MEAVAFSGMAILGLLGLGSGGAGGDLASFLPADAYFQSRRVPVNIENLEDLAKADPADGKAQILQLLALRTMAERPELVNKAKNKADVLKTLEKIAKGEIAKDRLGFSKEYATRTLIALGSNRAPPKRPKAGDPREHCLGWFPANSTLVGFLDGSRAKEPGADNGKAVRNMLEKLMKQPRDWDRFFDVADMIGNVQIDRVGFAYAADAKDKDKDRIFVRISGKGDHKRIVEAIKALNKNLGGNGPVWKETKDAKGTPITIMQDRFGPALAFIGDADFVVAGYPEGGRRGQEPKHTDVLDQLLAIRAGKEMPVMKGNLKDRLAKVSDDTIGLLVGDVPEELRRNMFRGGPPAPKSVRLEALRAKEGVDLRFQAALEDADAAKDFTKFVIKLRQDGLDGLKKIPANVGLPPSAIASLQKTLESIQIQPKGAGVEGAVFVPSEALLNGPAWMLFSVGARAGSNPPPPPPLPPIRDRQSRLLLPQAPVALAG